jgi:ABC-2 type transport system permease protein
MKTFIIARRELGAFFVSPVAYIIGAAFLFITGLFFFFTVALSGVATLVQVFSVISIVLLFVAPILTMRLLAEEARTGTLELLLTSPVRDWEVIIGKFLAAFIFLLAMLIPTLYYLFLLTRYGNPDIPVTFSGYLGVLLLGAMLLSFGTLTSALSSNQIIAAILGVTLSLAFWLAGALGTAFQGRLGDLFEYLSLQNHFSDFMLGLITSTNVVYFLSVTATALFLATRVLEVRRWH